MTPAPATIGTDTSLSAARKLMTAYAVRHLPVVDTFGAPLSVVSERDLAIAEAIFDEPEKAAAAHVVRLLSHARPYIVSAGTALHSVIHDMVRDKVDAVLVVDQGRLLGILTATDACRLFANHLQREHTLKG